MRTLPLIAALLTAAGLAVSATASTGYYSAWRCSAPCDLPVDISAMPAAEQPLLQAAMAKWNLTGRVDMHPSVSGGTKIRVVPCGAGTQLKGMKGLTCGFVTDANYQNGVLHTVTVYISDQWFGWDGLPRIYCHELGHALGFSDGAVEPDPALPPDQTSASCMAGTGPDPGVEDYALLARMYP